MHIEDHGKESMDHGKRQRLLRAIFGCYVKRFHLRNVFTQTEADGVDKDVNRTLRKFRVMLVYILCEVHPTYNTFVTNKQELRYYMNFSKDWWYQNYCFAMSWQNLRECWLREMFLNHEWKANHNFCECGWFYVNSYEMFINWWLYALNNRKLWIDHSFVNENRLLHWIKKVLDWSLLYARENRLLNQWSSIHL